MNTYAEAQAYVGTNETSGRFQFDVLCLEGCNHNSMVLEIGCGCLHSATPLVQYLDYAHYVGIDPNEWLRESAPEKVRELMVERGARFLSVSDFSASELGQKYDFILSHSVLSHCAHAQMEQFLANTSAVLKPHGKIVATIRLAEGNPWGSHGHPRKEDSQCKEWQYPGVSFFRLETVSRAAVRCGLVPMLVPEYTRRMVTVCPAEFHDWMVFVCA